MLGYSSVLLASVSTFADDVKYKYRYYGRHFKSNKKLTAWISVSGMCDTSFLFKTRYRNTRKYKSIHSGSFSTVDTTVLLMRFIVKINFILHHRLTTSVPEKTLQDILNESKLYNIPVQQSKNCNYNRSLCYILND